MEKTIHCKAFAYHLTICLLLLTHCDCRAQNLDINWLRTINEHRNRSLDGVMEAATNSAYVVTIGTPLAQLVYGYATHSKQRFINGLETTGALAITTALTLGLKYSVDRERPYTRYPDIVPYQYEKDPSFPSGHTSIAFATATSLALEYRAWYVIVPAYAWAGTVGYSRLHLGEHYPSDVLAGAITGAGSAWLSHWCNHWLHQHKLKKKLYSPIEQ